MTRKSKEGEKGREEVRTAAHGHQHHTAGAPSKTPRMSPGNPGRGVTPDRTEDTAHITALI
ncbi:hypothetical protein AMTR_s00051p00079440 [Amborella trichopoda]|uniref:Uncharacterized protein n=1 Tax=Amborella trichopoda TaxID=13333 RepID=U5D2I1_AMBTC|nr:hypothetical protein AMTR_s00051p00079440 [Amborella trichopoda]